MISDLCMRREVRENGESVKLYVVSEMSEWMCGRLLIFQGGLPQGRMMQDLLKRKYSVCGESFDASLGLCYNGYNECFPSAFPFCIPHQCIVTIFIRNHSNST